MNLAEVQKKMLPGAEAALAENLNLDEATVAFQLTLIDRVLSKCDGVQKGAAETLKTSPQRISRIMLGKFSRGGRIGVSKTSTIVLRDSPEQK